jgi:hypothetical protein
LTSKVTIGTDVNKADSPAEKADVLGSEPSEKLMSMKEGDCESIENMDKILSPNLSCINQVELTTK